MSTPGPAPADSSDVGASGPQLTIVTESHTLNAVTAETEFSDGRRVRGSATRTNGLAAAAELFSTQGYAATSISAIAAAAGVHSASLYHAFGSKEGMLAAVVEHASNEFYEHLDWLDGAVTIAEAIERLKEAFLQRPLFLRMLLILVLERGSAGPALLETASDVRERGRGLMRETLARELPTVAEDVVDSVLEDLSRLLMTFLDGAFVASQIDADDTQLAHLFDVLARAMRALIADYAATS